MKNKLIKISNLLSFCIIILFIAGCPPGKKPAETALQGSKDSSLASTAMDSSRLLLKQAMKDYNIHFGMKLLNYSDTVSFLDSVFSIEASWFDCNMSDPSLREHILYYNDAFAYILHFQENYHILASAEIPLLNVNVLRNTRNTDENANTNCGLLLYLGIDVANMFTICYHAEANVGRDASRIFPRTSTTYEYFKAECPVTNRTPIPDPNNLNTEVTRYVRLCPWSSPALTCSNDKMNSYGFELIRQMGVLQPPIAFFHSKELSDLISQNDADPNISSHCTGVRFYYGYDNDDTNPIKIKLIGFAMDGSGKNIMYKYDGTPAIMIERSWPPD
jgi:hypothetical protein